MLGENVSGINITIVLHQFYAPGPNGLLYPQSVSVKVAELAKALTGTCPHSRAGIGPYSEREVLAEVSHDTLVAEAGAPIEFGLSAAQGDVGLR